MTKKIIIICALLGLAGAAQAAAPKAKSPVDELKCLIGTWRGEGKLDMEGQQAKVEATYECTESRGGAGVKCTGEMTGIPGMASYVWDDLWGFDPGDGRVHWFTVTNAGETHDHAGKLSKRGFDAKFEGQREGKPFVEEIRFHFTSTTKLKVSSVGKVSGKAVEKLQVRFEKTDG